MQTGRAALVVGPIALAALSALAACGSDAAAAFGGLVEFVVEPPCAHRVARMDLGALQHVDRSYTYDVVPLELVGGALLQGVHRPPAGTRVTFELAASARVYVFFHATVDGGFGAAFAALDGWRRQPSAPQYDIHNGDHGHRMVMYARDFGPGRHALPATTADRGCFNVVVQPVATPR